ncbi:hypothetical protein ATO6_12510 [Oceanicola sp. 22II-s10i]|uniref:GNAT family N-acetyltransferase n=1 Tax=Oceanicola sp. 22II-s10i TaxID=1317116 RepID=UPI000B524C55|nr:GNAT family N-acetyltransferase [Oceanicola sp. 22II-s10i]OWU84501.1 hypothetical protein ATO6_12510 [Oceanicola sp. 22II-s10i]
MDMPVIRAFGPDDLEWIVATHARLYAEENGFDETFGLVVRQVAQAFLDRNDPREAGFVAVSGDRRVGSILSTRLDETTGQVRLFLIEPEMRGTGLGPRLLAAAEDIARGQGCVALKLWTHESHRAACALYARFGWTAGAGRPITNYGQPLVEMTWTKTL